MFLQTIRFKRTEKDKEEWGILTNEGDGIVLSLDGQEVKEIWDYRRTLHFVLELRLPDDELKSRT